MCVSDFSKMTMPFYIPTTESEERKSLLKNVKEESEKVGLNSTFRKLRSQHSAHHFMANSWGNNGNSETLFWGL